MEFNLYSLRLGDVLMAMPAMRSGDVVHVRAGYEIEGLPVEWTNSAGGHHPRDLHLQHQTDAWLKWTGREPVKHELVSQVTRDLLVIAPTVRSKSKQWNKWHALEGTLITEEHSRLEWIELLTRAHTVVCPDTGTAHMADALGVPKIVVLHGLGRKHFERYAPYWNRKDCIVKDSMEDISVEDVMEKLNG